MQMETKHASWGRWTNGRQKANPLLNLGVRVRKRGGELGHDERQALAELLGRAVRHGAQQRNRRLLRAPRRVVQRFQNLGQHLSFERFRYLFEEKTKSDPLKSAKGSNLLQLGKKKEKKKKLALKHPTSINDPATTQY
jgi:hypothetical protein